MNTSQENYLKAIYSLSEKSDSEFVNTSSIAHKLEMKPASVTEMLKKFEAKKLVEYKKYKGAKLSKKGSQASLNIIRKHRLWEVFLLKKLHFKWDEVHEIAEQLEHIQSRELTDRLDDFLENPRFDPHGDPIPDKHGVITDNRNTSLLSEMEVKETGIMTGVQDSSSIFLKYLERINITLGQRMEVLDKMDFDGSMILIAGEKEVSISAQAAQNIIIRIN